MKNRETLGILAVAITYVAWGLLTVFWNLLKQVDSLYILTQRIIWSMVLMGAFLLVCGKGREILAACKNSKNLIFSFTCGILVTINWGVYIYAVNSGHVLDASLGYFIEPILVGLLGVIAFQERLSLLEKLTFAFSVLALVYMLAVMRALPVLALLIAGSFAAYGAVKKALELTPCVSLFMETLCMTPFALLYAIWAEAKGMGSIGILSGAQLLLLPACGLVTLLPLLLFNIGVREIPYYLSGILMYINPTLQFMMGVYYFHEEMDGNRLTAFVIIWLGVLLTIYEKGKLLLAERRMAATMHKNE